MTTANQLEIVRIFAAPRDKVFTACSAGEHYAKWYGPQSVTVPVCKIDFQVGGKRLVCMEMPNGHKMWTGGVHREIVPGERFVATEYMADDQGNQLDPTVMGMESWPAELNLEISLADAAGKTELTLRFGPLEPSPMRDQCANGWNQALDKLADYLTQI